MSNGMWSVALGAAAPAAERTCSALSSSRSSFNNLVNQTCPAHILLLLLLLGASFLLLRAWCETQLSLTFLEEHFQFWSSECAGNFSAVYGLFCVSLAGAFSWQFRCSILLLAILSEEKKRATVGARVCELFFLLQCFFFKVCFAKLLFLACTSALGFLDFGD